MLSRLAAPAALSVLLLACSSLKPTAASDPDAGTTPESEAGTEADAAAPRDGGTCNSPCATPPVAVCSGGNAITYLGQGKCVDYKCKYTEVARTCKNGSCSGGICQELDWQVDAPAAGKGIYSVWGPAPDDIWAVGDGVYHFNGTGWVPEDIGFAFDASKKAWSVHGTNADDVTIMVSDTNVGPTTLYRRVPGRWTNVGRVTVPAYGGAIRGMGANRFLVHLGSDGLFLSTPTSIGEVVPMQPFIAGHLRSNSLSSFPGSDVLVAGYGSQGTLMFKNNDAKAYADQATAVVYVPDAVGGIYAGDTVWLYDPGTAADVGTVQLSVVSGVSDGYWQALSGTSRARLFAAGTKGIVMRRDATGWIKEPALPSPGGIVHLWATPWGDVYAAGATLWRGK